MKDCPYIDIKIGKGVNNTRSEISLVMEDLYAHLQSQVLQMLEFKLQSAVL